MAQAEEVNIRNKTIGAAQNWGMRGLKTFSKKEEAAAAAAAAIEPSMD